MPVGFKLGPWASSHSTKTLIRPSQKSKLSIGKCECTSLCVALQWTGGLSRASLRFHPQTVGKGSSTPECRRSRDGKWMGTVFFIYIYIYIFCIKSAVRNLFHVNTDLHFRVTPSAPMHGKKIDCDNSLSWSRHSEQMQLHQGVGPPRASESKSVRMAAMWKPQTSVSQR